MKKHIALFILSLPLLTGCPYWAAVKATVPEAAKNIADESLQVTLWKLCLVSSIGSINRWVAGDQELADAYNVICNRSKQADVIATDE